MNASDRVALMLGRAILRAEQLADELAEAKIRIEKLEEERSDPAAKERP